MKAVGDRVNLLRRSGSLLVLWAIALLGAAAGVATASAGASPSPGSRKALVIGNDTYQSIPTLARARADATAIAAALTDLGFSVALRTDLDGRAMRTALREFVASLRGGDEAVVYFAGHGVQLGTANYLLPIDAPADEETHVRDESMPLQRILDALSEREVRVSVVIVDACRDNPFRTTAGRSIGARRGLATTSPANGQLVMFSAGAGQTALDSLGARDTSPNGVFTRVLLAQLRRPEAPADQILRDVREQVVTLARSVGHDQVPALYDQMVGRFYFRQGAEPAMRVAPDARITDAELALWTAVRESSDPAELQVYLETFPDGAFTASARTRIGTLSNLQRLGNQGTEDLPPFSAVTASNVAAALQRDLSNLRLAAEAAGRAAASAGAFALPLTLSSPDAALTAIGLASTDHGGERIDAIDLRTNDAIPTAPTVPTAMFAAVPGATMAASAAQMDLTRVPGFTRSPSTTVSRIHRSAPAVLRTEMEVCVNEDGTVSGTPKVMKSSGDRAFDGDAKRWARQTRWTFPRELRGPPVCGVRLFVEAPNAEKQDASLVRF